MPAPMAGRLLLLPQKVCWGDLLIRCRGLPCTDVLFTCYARVDQSTPLIVPAYKKACFTNGFHVFSLNFLWDPFGAPSGVRICFQLLTSFGEQGATVPARYELHAEHVLRYALQDPQGPARVVLSS